MIDHFSFSYILLLKLQKLTPRDQDIMGKNIQRKGLAKERMFAPLSKRGEVFADLPS